MKVSPILPQHLDEVGRFLHEHLNRRFSAERWVYSLTRPWAAQPPNCGMQLRDGDKLVGVFCAVYSDQVIAGRTERFCNPHSWFVLDSHRRHGIGLVLNIVKQAGYHFTMFTPNPKVAEVFRGLKFKDLDDRQFLCLNTPTLASLGRHALATSTPDRITERLQGQDLIDFQAHQSIPWLRFAAFGRGDDLCWVVYKPTHWKRLPSAWVMHVSNPGAFARHDGLLRQHLLARGMVTMRVEARWLEARPKLARAERRGQPKLFLSKTLVDKQIRDLYSELTSLDV